MNINKCGDAIGTETLPKCVTFTVDLLDPKSIRNQGASRSRLYGLL